MWTQYPLPLAVVLTRICLCNLAYLALIAFILDCWSTTYYYSVGLFMTLEERKQEVAQGSLRSQIRSERSWLILDQQQEWIFHCSQGCNNTLLSETDCVSVSECVYAHVSARAHNVIRVFVCESVFFCLVGCSTVPSLCLCLLPLLNNSQVYMWN